MTKVRISTDKGYYIGDPCYILDDFIYDSVWGDEFSYASGRVFKDGVIDMFVFPTEVGDGDFPLYDESGEKKEFICDLAVDSGTIAVIPLEYLDTSRFNSNLSFMMRGDGYLEFGDEDDGIEIKGVFNHQDVNYTCDTELVD